MRRIAAWLVLVWLLQPSLVHADDAHTEMAAALEAQADTHPAPAALPIASSPATRTAAATKSAATRAGIEAGTRAAERIHQALLGLSTALARQAQAATQAAAGLTQAQAAKDRASRPTPNR